LTGIRVGQGFDVHRFGAGRALSLCGVVIEGESGLDGHSDADVCLHAVTDAILGAVARGDIGELFPDSDRRWHGVESSIFVAHAIKLAADDGFSLINCDLTVIGEQPRIAPHRERMRNSLAKILGLPQANVSVKATTTEGLGFVGRSEGLAALAVVLMAEDRDG
jgi:2-C-methyl-D-erythritol 4-phosphate cytidylyltransferase/2-C-methyl-D-erythritol 2,4-cyclodiphosphate synthase